MEKLNSSQESLKKNFSEIQSDLNLVGKTIHDWVDTLPAVRRELLREEFEAARAHLASPEFKKDFNPQNPFAENSLQEILDVSNESMHSLYQLGYDLYQEGSVDKARGVFRFLTLLNPLGVPYWIGLGTVFILQARVDDAISTFEIARSLDPSNPESSYFLARCLFMNGQLELALTFAKKAQELSKKEVHAPCLQSSIQLQGQIEQKLGQKLH